MSHDKACLSSRGQPELLSAELGPMRQVNLEGV